jgi:hypothetical protein
MGCFRDLKGFFNGDDAAIFPFRINEADFLRANGSIYPIFRCTDLVVLLSRIFQAACFKGGSHNTIPSIDESTVDR